MLIDAVYETGAWRQALLAMPDDLLYFTLWALYSTARDAFDQGAVSTKDKFAKAFVEGRLKKTRRTKAGTCRVFIAPPQA